MKAINGHTKVCGVMGCPVEHTLSPVIHNYLAEAMDINMVYVPFRVDPRHINKAVHGAWALGIPCMNVTVPHKQTVMECLSEIDPGAQAIGAVNTLVAGHTGYVGYNTDWIGFGRFLERAGIDVEGRDVIVLGAGGAARCAVYYCAGKGAAHICVLNRSLDKAEALAGEMSHLFPGCAIQALSLGQWAEVPGEDLIAVQSTQLGMTPEVNTVVIEDAGFYRKLSAAVDVVYTPAETLFMKLCEQAGVPARNGLDMLLYQGIAAFELWTGAVVPEAMADHARELLLNAMEDR